MDRDEELAETQEANRQLLFRIESLEAVIADQAVGEARWRGLAAWSDVERQQANQRNRSELLKLHAQIEDLTKQLGDE